MEYEQKIKNVLRKVYSYEDLLSSELSENVLYLVPPVDEYKEFVIDEIKNLVLDEYFQEKFDEKQLENNVIELIETEKIKIKLVGKYDKSYYSTKLPTLSISFYGSKKDLVNKEILNDEGLFLKQKF